MKKLILILFLIFAFAQWGEGATFYVRTGGAATKANAIGPCNSTATTMSIVTHNAATFSAGDTIVICSDGGALAATITVPSSGASGNRINYIGSGNPVITGGASYTINTNAKSYLLFQNLVCDGKDFLFNGGTDLVANYCIAKNSTSVGFFNYVATGVVLNNCVAIGNALSGIMTNGTNPTTATTTINNCIVTGNGFGSASYAGIYTATTWASATVSNSLVIGNIAQAVSNTKNISAATTIGTGNITTKVSDVKSGINNNPYFIFTSDGPDDLDLSYWKSINTVLAPYGGKATFFVVGSYVTTAEQKADMVTLAAAGHEFENYTYSASDMTSTQALAISSTNTNPTVNVDLANKTMTLSCDEVGNRVTVTWTSDVSWNAGSKQIKHLVNAASGKGWTITREDDSGTQIKDTVNLASQVDTAGAQACPYTTMLDVSTPTWKYWVHEVDDNAAYLNDILGTAGTTHAYPHGYNSAGIQTWLSTRYLAARGTAATLQRLNSLNVYNTFNVNYTYFTGTEATIRSNVNHFVELMKQIGGVIQILSHTEAELPSAKLAIVADELSKLGITFRTFADVMTELKANHSTVDNITYTKTYPDVSDFHLTQNSPCINAGVDVGIRLDIELNAVPSGYGVDIGAYELGQFTRRYYYGGGVRYGQ